MRFAETSGDRPIKPLALSKIAQDNVRAGFRCLQGHSVGNLFQCLAREKWFIPGTKIGQIETQFFLTQF